MPGRLVRNDPELDQYFHVGDDPEGNCVRLKCKSSGCPAEWEIDGDAVDLGMRNALLSHARAHVTKYRMRRVR